MIITALSDLHGDVARLPEIAADLAASDVVLLTGDVTHFGRREDAQRVIAAVRAFNGNILAVPGNCDHPEAAAWLAAEGISLDETVAVREGLAFLGLGGSLPCPGATPNEMPESAFRERLERTAAGLEPGRPFILVTHQPPRDTLADRLAGGSHAGSVAVRAFIAERKPLISFCGHIHEGRGIDAVGPTRVVNPGPLGRGGHAFAVVSEKGEIETLEIRT